MSTTTAAAATATTEATTTEEGATGVHRPHKRGRLGNMTEVAHRFIDQGMLMTRAELARGMPVVTFTNVPSMPNKKQCVARAKQITSSVASGLQFWGRSMQRLGEYMETKVDTEDSVPEEDDSGGEETTETTKEHANTITEEVLQAIVRDMP